MPVRSFSVTEPSEDQPQHNKFSEARQNLVVRIFTMSPLEGERYCFRILLLHLAGAEKFSGIRNVFGNTESSFQKTGPIDRRPRQEQGI